MVAITSLLKATNFLRNIRMSSVSIRWGAGLGVSPTSAKRLAGGGTDRSGVAIEEPWISGARYGELWGGGRSPDLDACVELAGLALSASLWQPKGFSAIAITGEAGLSVDCSPVFR